jgi:hypothetical protein
MLSSLNKIDRIHYSMLDVQCSMFDVHFLVNPLYETSPEWHGFLMIKLAASAASGWADT